MSLKANASFTESEADHLPAFTSGQFWEMTGSSESRSRRYPLILEAFRTEVKLDTGRGHGDTEE